MPAMAHLLAMVCPFKEGNERTALATVISLTIRRRRTSHSGARYAE
jgi:hypothetical protein